ncbi:hypothetical protein Q7C36_020032 [Tachysurus vachellii]|uniref:Uncharacterized protein n=1 Tax=Tachysurus vachellii TaxID=175792 RepID=A0AA88LST2_TACVA|nr:hypothetical protein Q7C36_020032 [Tachysurus vachellii]
MLVAETLWSTNFWEERLCNHPNLCLLCLEHVSPPKPTPPPEHVSPPKPVPPPETMSQPEPASPPETMSQPEPVQTDTANTKFQPEETVHYVPATKTPDLENVPDNLYIEYNPMYYTEYYQFLPLEFYPKPLKVETVEEDCFLPSPQSPHNHQPILPERKRTLIKNQDPNDGGRDIMVNKLLGGTAMYPTESAFPPENVSVPQHVSPPESASLLKPVSPPKPASPPEPVSPPEPASPPEHVSPPEPASPPEPVSPPEPASPPEPVSPPEPASPPEPVSPPEPASPPEPVSPPKPASPPEPVSPPKPASPPEPVPPPKLIKAKGYGYITYSSESEAKKGCRNGPAEYFSV